MKHKKQHCIICDNEIKKFNRFYFCNTCIKKRNSVKVVLIRKMNQFKKEGHFVFVSNNRKRKTLEQCIYDIFSYSLVNTSVGNFFISLKK